MSDIFLATADAFRLLLAGEARLWEIIGLSLGTSVIALALVAPLALAAAYALAAGRFFGRRLLVAVLHGLLSFPTVVIGLVLYLALSRGGVLGGVDLLFTPQAIVIGQALIAFPVLAAFALTALEKNLIITRETARSLGAGRLQTLLTVCGEARFALIAALLAGFGRVVSEVGCALIVGGNIAHYTRTITTAIALETGKGAFVDSIALGIVLVVVAITASALLAATQSRWRGEV